MMGKRNIYYKFLFYGIKHEKEIGTTSQRGVTGRESARIIRGRHKIVSLHDGVDKEVTHVHAGRVPEENILSSGAKLLRRLVCKSTENISHNVVIILVCRFLCKGRPEEVLIDHGQ